jgi:hypothetical protein
MWVIKIIKSSKTISFVLLDYQYVWWNITIVCTLHKSILWNYAMLWLCVWLCFSNTVWLVNGRAHKRARKCGTILYAVTQLLKSFHSIVHTDEFEFQLHDDTEKSLILMILYVFSKKCMLHVQTNSQDKDRQGCILGTKLRLHQSQDFWPGSQVKLILLVMTGKVVLYSSKVGVTITFSKVTE